MATTTLTLKCAEGEDPVGELSQGAVSGATMLVNLTRLLNFLKALLAGALNSAVQVIAGVNVASGTLAFSGATGTVGGTINGVALTFAHGASDQADSNTMVATINASTNALVQYLVKASNYAATFTLSTCAVGTVLNVLGVQFRAVAAASGVMGEFDVSGNDTADATALAAAINAHRGLREKVVASSSSGVVTIRSIETTPTVLDVTVVSGSGATASGNLAATTTVLVTSFAKGTIGNQTTLAASGTGVTASGARLTGGTNQTVVTV